MPPKRGARRKATVVATTAAAMTITIAPVHTSGRRRRAGRQLTHVRPGLRERAQGVEGFGAGQRGVQGAVCGAWRAAVRPPAAIAIEGLQQPGVHHGVWEQRGRCAIQHPVDQGAGVLVAAPRPRRPRRASRPALALSPVRSVSQPRTVRSALAGSGVAEQERGAELQHRHRRALLRTGRITRARPYPARTAARPRRRCPGDRCSSAVRNSRRSVSITPASAREPRTYSRQPDRVDLGRAVAAPYPDIVGFELLQILDALEFLSTYTATVSDAAHQDRSIAVMPCQVGLSNPSRSWSDSVVDSALPSFTAAWSAA